MRQRSTASTPRHASSGVFHDYVRGVFGELFFSRPRLLRAKRARRLQRVARRPVSGAEQRWEGEGGSTR